MPSAAPLRRSLVDACTQADVLVWPTVPAPAPPIEDTDRAACPPGAVPADYANVRMGGIANLTGAPALSAPVGLTSAGLPAGLQLMTHWRDPERLLDVADLLEQVDRPPARRRRAPARAEDARLRRPEQDFCLQKIRQLTCTDK